MVDITIFNGGYNGLETNKHHWGAPSCMVYGDYTTIESDGVPNRETLHCAPADLRDRSSGFERLRTAGAPFILEVPMKFAPLMTPDES